MHKSVLLENLNIIKKQRNLFLSLSAFLLITNFLLSFKVTTADQKIIMVPGLKQEMLVSNAGVSRSYLEEMSLLFLSNLLDLSPSDIEHKKELVLRYTSNSNKQALDRLIKYFSKCIQDYRRFNLTTYFTAKNLEIDLENLTVIAHGILTSYYGKEGHESEDEDYRLEFEWQGGNLRLKSFVRIVDEAKRARDRAKSLRLEEEQQEDKNDTVSQKNTGINERPSDSSEFNDEDDEGEPL